MPRLRGRGKQGTMGDAQPTLVNALCHNIALVTHKSVVSL